LVYIYWEPYIKERDWIVRFNVPIECKIVAPFYSGPKNAIMFRSSGVAIDSFCKFGDIKKDIERIYDI